MTITKAHLLKAVKPYTKHKDILNALFLEINKALVRRETIMIANFGVIYVDKCRVKWGHNFHTNERMLIKPNYKIKFKASKVIEKIVNDRNLIEG